MQKHTFQHNKLTFSYLDAGGDGPMLIALHAHWMEGITFAPLAATLSPEWRVVHVDNPIGFAEVVTAFLQELV